MATPASGKTRRALGRSPCQRCSRPGSATLPESPRNCPDPGAPRRIAAFGRQSARKFTNHESGRQAPENREKEQHKNSMAITRTGDDRLCPVSAPRHHEEGGGNKRPEGQLGDGSFRVGKRLGRNMCGERYSAQFFSLVLLK